MVTSSPKALPCEILFPPHIITGYFDMALLPFINPTTCDTEYFGGIEIKYEHDPPSSDLPQFYILSALLNLSIPVLHIALALYIGSFCDILVSKQYDIYNPKRYGLNFVVLPLVVSSF
jgi:hypothetical protein